MGCILCTPFFYMKKFLILFLVFYSCRREPVFMANRVKLRYMNSFFFKKTDSLSIDDETYFHSMYIDSMSKYLPMKYVGIKKGNKIFKEPINKLFLSINLAEKIISSDKYIIHNRSQVLLEGVIDFSRKDSLPIKINFSKDYPIYLERIK